MKSKYMQIFKKLNLGIIKLNGDRLLVEMVSRDEIKTKSGIILPQSESNKSFAGDIAQFGIVLAVGEGFYLEENGVTECVPLDYEVGDIVLLNTFHAKFFPSFGPLSSYTKDTICITTSDGIHMAIKDTQKFEDILTQGE